MALTRTANQPTQGQTRYRFDYSGTTAIIDRKADQAAHYLFDLGRGEHGTEEEPRTYEDLSLTEKLALLDEYVRQVILDLSKAFAANTAADAARDAAIATEEGEVIT